MNRKELDGFFDKFLKSCGTGAVRNLSSEDVNMVYGTLCHSHGTEVLESFVVDERGEMVYLGRELSVEEELVLETLSAFIERLDVGVLEPA